MSGTVLFTPGEEVPVEVVDNGNGLPAVGESVEVAGETAEMTQVETIAAQGNEGVGVVTQMPSDEDGNVVAGEGTILLSKPVVAMPESTSGANAAGALVQEDAGGSVTGYPATTATDTALGQVFAANAAKYGFGIGDRVAVALHR